MDAVEHDASEIAVKEREDSFCFRIPEAAVEFYHLRPFAGDHETGIEAAFEGVAFLLHGRYDRTEDADIDFFAHLFGHDRCGSIGTHAACIRSFIEVKDTLVILRGNHRNDVRPVAEAEHAGFFAFHEFFDDDRSAGTAEGMPFEHILHGVDGFFFALCDDDALAGGQTVSLDDDRIGIIGFQVSDGFFFIIECLICSCRDAIFLHESFGESFGAFDAGRCLGRAKEGHASLFKFIRKALGQDGLRTGDGEVDLHEAGEVDDILISFDRNE